VTACTVLQKVAATGYMDRVELGATYKTTSLPNEVYYLDVEPAAEGFTWDTAHPEGDYVAIAQVQTDASANIHTVTDLRPLTGTPFAGLAAALNVVPPDGSLTLAKFADIATSRLLGRVSSGDGIPEELDAPAIRALLNVAEGAVTLGETEETAYRGDRGKTAYDHSQSAHLQLGATSTTAYRGDRGTTAYNHSQSPHSYLPLAGGTMTGILYPQQNTSYTTGQARRIILSTGDPTGGGNGDVWIKYEA